MTTLFVSETFTHAPLSDRLTWFNPPPAWRVTDHQLIVQPAANTDFWQRTHYGFRADNGHFLYTTLTGDFVLSAHVHFNPANQYDQAGLMVRISADCWLKTSVEYEPDKPDWLGTVVTNHGYSDWSTQSFPPGYNHLALRIRRENNVYTVEHRPPHAPNAAGWVQMRLATLLADDGLQPVQAGLYACSPRGEGYSAAFDFLKITTP